MNLDIVQRPRVKDLLVRLQQCDPEALIFVSDKHDPVDQMFFMSGVTPVDETGAPVINAVYSAQDIDCAKATHPLKRHKLVPSVQIDTGC